MKTIKIWNIPNTIKRLTFDGDKTDLRLHLDIDDRWGAQTKKDYQKAERQIDKMEFKGNGWTIYATYDVSGFQYWMKQMQETNYISISILFENEDINKSEVAEIEMALHGIECQSERLAEIYSYDPSDLASIND